MTPRVTVRKSGRGFVVMVNGKRLRALPYYDRGCRQTYIGGDYVVKLDDKYGQNKREAKVFSRVARTKDREHFPKLLAAAKDYLWILVSRFRPLKTRDVPPEMFCKVRSLARRNRVGLSDIWMEKGDSINWGMCGEMPVIFDAGM